MYIYSAFQGMPVDLLASLDISLVEEHMLRAFYCYLNQVVKTREKRYFQAAYGICKGMEAGRMRNQHTGEMGWLWVASISGAGVPGILRYTQRIDRRVEI